MGVTVFTFYFVALLVMLGVESFSGWSGGLLILMVGLLGMSAISAAVRIVKRG